MWACALWLACVPGPGVRAAPDAAAEPAAAAPSVRLAEAFRARERGEPLEARVERVRREASALGMRSVEPAARGLLLADHLGQPAERAAAATRLAPGLPAAWAARARHAGAGSAVTYGTRGVLGLERHLEASIWWRSTATRVLAWACVLGGTWFLLLAAFRAAIRARHDFADRLPASLRVLPPEAMVALLLGAALVPALFGEGLAGLAAGGFLLAIAWSPAPDRAAVLGALLLVGVGIHPVTEQTGRWIAALESDPGTLAVRHAEVADLSTAQREALHDRAEIDPAAANALALWSRRSGDHDAAAAWLDGVSAAASGNPVLLNQLANLALARGDGDAALDYYERASRADRRAEILFNRAQVHGSRIELAEQQQALEAAHAVSAATVRELSELRGEGRLAVDLAWPVADLRQRLWTEAEGGPVAAALRAPFGAGRLVASPREAAVALGVLVVFGLGLGRAARPGERCRGCRAVRFDAREPEGERDPGVRYCNLCGERWPEEGALRRLASVARGFVLRWVPGAAGLSAQRAWLGLASSFAVAGGIAAVVLREGVVVDSMSAGLAGQAAFVLLAAFALLVHGVVTVAARRAST